MTELPDIAETARWVAKSWYHEEWDPAEYIQQQLVEMIAAALAEEREKAARIVETWADDHLTIQPSLTRMAAAIRRGTK